MGVLAGARAVASFASLLGFRFEGGGEAVGSMGSEARSLVVVVVVCFSRNVGLEEVTLVEADMRATCIRNMYGWRKSGEEGQDLAASLG